jgi:hypothetical protein
MCRTGYTHGMICALLLAASAPAPSIRLFDGRTLNGWTQLNGTATYTVEDGAIVGRTAEGSPNSFLCSDRQFGDFELFFEVKVDDPLNSGCQIRSLQSEGLNGQPEKGRVWGPQVEIMAGPGHSGYIYGEATRFGWLSPEPNQPNSNHIIFKNGGWNMYRILAQGPRIQTWVNGIKVADLTHEEVYKTHSRGFIGLQVHSIARGSGPYEVRWRNLRILER